MPRQIFRLGLFTFALFGACAHSQATAPQSTLLQPSESAVATSSKSAPTAQTSDPRRLTATRTHDGRSASGSVLLHQPVASDTGESPHLKLAGTRAWIALGEQRIDAQDWLGAIACTRAGLAELGDDYVERRAIEHTGMKILFAEHYLKQGDHERAARNMLHQLTIRTRLYARLHADTIAE